MTGSRPRWSTLPCGWPHCLATRIRSATMILVKINHCRTDQGHCASCHKQCSLTASDKCQCDRRHTMFHIVNSCPQTRLDGARSSAIASLGWWCCCSMVDVTQITITTTTYQLTVWEICCSLEVNEVYFHFISCFNTASYPQQLKVSPSLNVRQSWGSFYTPPVTEPTASKQWVTMIRRRDLNVVVWIPVRVIDDDGVCGRQVDAKTAGTRWQQETECRRPNGCVAHTHRHTTSIHTSPPPPPTY